MKAYKVRIKSSIIRLTGSTMARRYGRTISVDVDIDIDDVLSSMDDDDLIEELKSRHIDVSKYMKVNTSNLKELMEFWFQMKGLPRMWTFTEDQILEIVRTQINIGR